MPKTRARKRPDVSHTTITCYLDGDLKERIVKAADEDNRSLSSFIAITLKNAVAKKEAVSIEQTNH